MGRSLVSFRNDGCVENYGPDSLFNKLSIAKKETIDKPKTSSSSQTKTVIQLLKMVNNVPQFNLKRSKFVTKDNKVQQSKTHPGKIKFKRRVQNFKKFGK